ncbi:hypothetical protein EVAR_88695_1 [Eumeta japonica]|uniref:Uncharacterized protein n=1 Tax=Eumeta variegata TaxID=151549 RepID=A0A4C1Y170_EUMVA|nr:hypothetical protein EVAR_88695_1 [Eumeta japonica]
MTLVDYGESPAPAAGPARPARALCTSSVAYVRRTRGYRGINSKRLHFIQLIFYLVPGLPGFERSPFTVFSRYLPLALPEVSERRAADLPDFYYTDQLPSAQVRRANPIYRASSD